MIKLFRNIRQRLITEGNTSKYLKYAIGEILLVVIGILIALQVNNWNNDRLTKRNEVNQIKLILEDAKADSIFFNERLKFYKQGDSLQKTLLSLFDPKIQDSVSQLKMSDYQNYFGIRLLSQSNVVFNNKDLVNIIKNDSVSRALKKYFAKYEHISGVIESRNNIYKDNFLKFSDKYPEAMKQVRSDSLMRGFLALTGFKDIEVSLENSIYFNPSYEGAIINFIGENHELLKVLEAYLKEENNQ